MVTLDRFDRPLRSLRVSVTDRCNLRCQYCMPETDYVWLPRESILTFEEIARLVDAFAAVGVDRVRLTGGEPLLRRNLPDLVEQLAARSAIRGPRAHDQRRSAGRAGRRAAAGGASPHYRQPRHAAAGTLPALTRFDALPAVLAGIDAAAAPDFRRLKIDTVVIGNRNDDELVPLLEFGAGDRRRGALHRIHGRRRRHPLVRPRRRHARARSSRRLEERYGPIAASARTRDRPGRTFPAA